MQKSQTGSYTHFNFEPMAFATADARGQACYHTNVMLCVGTDFALGGFHLIADTQRRGAVRERLREGGRELIELDARQIGEFAGNALELSGRGGERLLALSERACASLSATQKTAIERSATLLPLAVPTIELGGVRCAACWRAFTWRGGPQNFYRNMPPALIQ